MSPARAGEVAAAAVAAGARVITTCGRGVCAVVRSAAPGALVISAADFPAAAGRARFAVRAAAFVLALSREPAPALVVFPSGPCPTGLRPARSWASGFGSGSWAEIALAVGRGVPVFVFLPAEVAPPIWPAGAWHYVNSGPLAGSVTWQPAPSLF
jgi:hypothetical protein